MQLKDFTKKAQSSTEPYLMAPLWRASEAFTFTYRKNCHDIDTFTSSLSHMLCFVSNVNKQAVFHHCGSLQNSNFVNLDSLTCQGRTRVSELEFISVLNKLNLVS